MIAITESVIEICQERGMQFRKNGGELYALCPFHNDGKRGNFRVNIEKNSWYCDVCGKGGGVVEFLALKDGREKKEVFKELVGKQDDPRYGGEIAATYDYKDRFGNLVYQVCRMVPKSFRQRRPDGKGGWIWNMEGVERILYKLPEILNPKNEHIWIVEGEKDVETIRGIGMAATTNVGGAGKWHEGYSQCLNGKHILLCGDNDEPGRKHMATVSETLEMYAASIRRIELPPQFKDISDFAASFNSREKFCEALQPIVDSAPVMTKGATLPIKSIAELEQEYLEQIRNFRSRLVALSDWIPSLSCVRPLAPGELVAVVGDTGSAKTYVLQHIAMHCRVPTLLFELELPGSLTFERFVAIARTKSGQDVFTAYNADERLDYSDLSHIYTCTKSRITPEEMESIILKSELRLGVRPSLVLVDYIQLVAGQGKRYERVSDIAEKLKVIAKTTGTVIVMASQIGRDKTEPDVNLHDAKDSGSIENSSGVVIGLWRDKDDASIINLRVLKNTRGRPSRVIQCLVLGESMRIVEMENRKINQEDVPK